MCIRFFNCSLSWFSFLFLLFHRIGANILLLAHFGILPLWLLYYEIGNAINLTRLYSSFVSRLLFLLLPSPIFKHKLKSRAVEIRFVLPLFWLTIKTELNLWFYYKTVYIFFLFCYSYLSQFCTRLAVFIIGSTFVINGFSFFVEPQTISYIMSSTL